MDFSRFEYLIDSRDNLFFSVKFATMLQVLYGNQPSDIIKTLFFALIDIAVAQNLQCFIESVLLT